MKTKNTNAEQLKLLGIFTGLSLAIVAPLAGTVARADTQPNKPNAEANAGRAMKPEREIEDQDAQGGPPSWAPAYGYRRKHGGDNQNLPRGQKNKARGAKDKAERRDGAENARADNQRGGGTVLRGTVKRGLIGDGFQILAEDGRTYWIRTGGTEVRAPAVGDRVELRGTFDRDTFFMERMTDLPR